MTVAHLFAFATLLASGAAHAEQTHHETAPAASNVSITRRTVPETPAPPRSHDRTPHAQVAPAPLLARDSVSPLSDPPASPLVRFQAQPVIAEATSPPHATSRRPKERPAPPLQQARIIENAGAAIPLELHFRDHVGRSVRLGGLFANERPIILVLADYRCRTLCPLVLDGTVRAVRESSLQLGVDYRVVTLSIDHRDGPRDAREMRGHILQRVGTSDSATDWTFLVGDESVIRSLADALGFGFAYDPATDQFAHPAVAFVLTPGARISAYLYGLEYEAAEVERALRAAASGRVYGGAIQRVLLRCFHYIPALRQHAGLVAGLLRTGALITVLLLGGWIAHLVWRGRTQEASR